MGIAEQIQQGLVHAHYPQWSANHALHPQKPWSSDSTQFSDWKDFSPQYSSFLSQ